jgi:hypothetical protein
MPNRLVGDPAKVSSARGYFCALRSRWRGLRREVGEPAVVVSDLVEAGLQPTPLVGAGGSPLVAESVGQAVAASGVEPGGQVVADIGDLVGAFASLISGVDRLVVVGGGGQRSDFEEPQVQEPDDGFFRGGLGRSVGGSAGGRDHWWLPDDS